MPPRCSPPSTLTRPARRRPSSRASSTLSSQAPTLPPRSPIHCLLPPQATSLQAVEKWQCYRGLGSTQGCSAHCSKAAHRRTIYCDSTIKLWKGRTCIQTFSGHAGLVLFHFTLVPTAESTLLCVKQYLPCWCTELTLSLFSVRHLEILVTCTE